MDEFKVKAHWLPRLLRVWTLAGLSTLAVMLTHHSDNPILFNRYSTLVVLLLAGLAFMVLAGLGAEWMVRRKPMRLEHIDHTLADWRDRHWFGPGVLVTAAALLAGVWLLFLGDHLATYGFLRAFVGFSIVVGTLALLFGGAPSPAIGGRWQYLVIAALTVLVVVALLTISFYPALMKTDEAVVFSMARNAAENGQIIPTIYRQAYHFPGGIWTWTMAAWLKLVGFGITAGRLYTLTISGVSLVFIWAAAQRLYDRSTALFAVLIGAFAFISLNHMRYDVHAALFLSIALLFYSLGHTHDVWWAHFLVGLAAGLCVDSNPIGYTFGIGFGLIYLVRYVQRIRTRHQWFWLPFWLLALGGILALAIFFLTRAGVMFEGGRTTTGSALAGYGEQIVQLLSIFYARKMVGEYLLAYLTHQPVLFGLVVMGIITAWWKRTASDRALLVLYVSWTVIILFAYYYFPVYYLVHVIPIIALLGARALTLGIPVLLKTGASSSLSRATTILLAIWFLAAMAKDITSQTSLEDVVETGRRIASIVPEDDVIVAAEPYYFGMPEHRGFVGGAIESFLVSFRGMPVEETWSYLAPDAIVFSSKWPTEPGHTPTLNTYLEAHQFMMVSCWETESYGHIELWMDELPPNVSVSNVCERICNPRTGCTG